MRSIWGKIVIVSVAALWTLLITFSLPEATGFWRYPGPLALWGAFSVFVIRAPDTL